MRLSHKMFIILCMSSVSFAAPAMAEDAPPAIQALLDTIERQTTVKPQYESLDADSSGNVTIKNLSVAKDAAGEEPSVNVKIGELVFSDISDEGGGVYKIGTSKFTGMSADLGTKEGPIKVSVPDGGAEGWYVTEVAEGAPAEQAGMSMGLAARTVLGKMTIEAQGNTFTVDGYESHWDGDPKTGAGTFDSKVTNIAIPEQALAMVDQGGMLKQLGYTSLSFDISGNGKTEISNGIMGLSFDMALVGHDMGAFKLDFAAADVPMAVLGELQKSQKEGKQPDFNALMPQLQNISLSGLSIRFEDDSITKKVLPMIAAMQGMDEAGLIASAGPMLQMGLMQLQNQAFAQQTAAAVNNFLKDPKSLTVTAKPPAPVKVSDLMMLNPAAPGEAITKLGVSVTSND